MMGQHLLQLDAEQDLLEAFASFDDEDKGWVKVDDVRKALQEMGDRMNAQEVCMYCVNRADPD
jgi:myosin regulatory light chain 12